MLNPSSKYPQSADPKVNFGPVFAVNPKFVVRLHVVELGDPSCSWVHVYGHGWDRTSELETLEWCNSVVEACTSINPDIVITREV